MEIVVAQSGQGCNRRLKKSMFKRDNFTSMITDDTIHYGFVHDIQSKTLHLAKDDAKNERWKDEMRIWNKRRGRWGGAYQFVDRRSKDGPFSTL